MTRKSYQADYFQKNKDEILAKRRLKRQREREAGQSQLFGSIPREESAAQPAKVEQQTVSNLEEANQSSISNVRELYPLKAEVYGDCGYAMAGGWTKGLAEFGASPSRTTRANVSSNYHQIASPNIEREVVDSQEVEQSGPRLVDSWKVDSQEVEQIRPDHVDQSDVDQGTRRPLSHFAISAGILVLLGANTFFLVHEQYSLYLALGYGFEMAVLIAVLTESLLISLSLLSAWTVDFVWKGALLTCCLLTVAVVVNILDSSARHRSDTAAQKSEQAERLKKEVATLEALEGTALAMIKKYDQRVYPTKINALMTQLEAPDSRGYSRRLREANAKLETITAVGSGDVEPLIWQRRIAMLCNLVLAGFLGFLWRRKEPNKVLEWFRSYFAKEVIV